MIAAQTILPALYSEYIYVLELCRKIASIKISKDMWSTCRTSNTWPNTSFQLKLIWYLRRVFEYPEYLLPNFFTTSQMQHVLTSLIGGWKQTFQESNQDPNQLPMQLISWGKISSDLLAHHPPSISSCSALTCTTDRMHNRMHWISDFLPNSEQFQALGRWWAMGKLYTWHCSLYNTPWPQVTKQLHKCKIYTRTHHWLRPNDLASLNESMRAANNGWVYTFRPWRLFLY